MATTDSQNRPGGSASSPTPHTADAEASAKPFLKRLWSDLKSEGWKKIVAGIVALACGIAAYSGKTLWKQSQIAWAHIRNLSQPEARSIASKFLGTQVSVVVPFRELNDRRQYILASMTPSEGLEQSSEVYLLISDENSYRSQRLGMGTDACGEIHEDDPLANPAGILELRHDGHHQIFISCTSGGSGAYSTRIFLLDISSGKSYQGSASGEYNDTDVKFEFSGEAPGDEAIKKWFQQKFEKDDMSNTFDRSSLAKEEAVWRQANPKPLDEPLHPHTYPGYPPDESFENGPPEFGDLKLDCIWKGPILAYDTKADNHFVLYAGGEYDHFNQILVAEGELFLLDEVPTDQDGQMKIDGIVYSPKSNRIYSYGSFMFNHSDNIEARTPDGKSVLLYHWTHAPAKDADSQ